MPTNVRLCPRMSSSCPLAHVIILNWKENREGLDGAIRRGLCYTRKKEPPVPYRKVTYREQIWYIIKFKLREIFRRRKKK